MRTFINFFVIGLAFAVVGCTRTTAVKGEVFVVTEGSGSYKFGLVNVNAIPEEQFDEFIRSNMSGYDSARETREQAYRGCALVTPFPFDSAAMKRMKSCDELKKAADGWLVDAFYNFPTTSPSAVTDSDGKYELKLQGRGRYALFAKAERKVGESTERYYWIVWLDADKAENNITFSNNNLLRKYRPEDILATHQSK